MSEEETTQEDLTFDDVGIETEDVKDESTDDDGETPPKEDEQKAEEGGEGKKAAEEPGEEVEKKGAEEEPKGDGDGDKPKSIRFRDGDDFKEIGEDSTVRVRVSGKNELVPLKELISNYSGATAYDEKFEALKQDREKYDEEVKGLQGELEKVGALMKGDNPLDAALYLAGMAGLEPVAFRQKIMENLSEEISELMGMDETARELRLIKSGQEVQARLQELAKPPEKSRDTGSNVDELIQVAGVTKEAYEESRSLLEEAGVDTSPVRVIENAKLAPYMNQAIDILEPYEENFGDKELGQFTATLATELQKVGGQNAEAVFKRVADHFDWELEEESKEAPPKKEPAKPKDEVVPEDLMFDDI